MTDFSEFSLLAVAFPKIRERLQLAIVEPANSKDKKIYS